VEIDDQVSVLELRAHRYDVLESSRVALERSHMIDRGIEAHDVGVLLLDPVVDARLRIARRERVHDGQRQDHVAERRQPEHRDAAKSARGHRDAARRAHTDELELVEAAVRPSARAARRACRADDPAALEHDDAVRVLDRRQPVRDDEHRAVAHEPSSAACTMRSLSVSSADVASSSSRIGGLRSSARAIARRWRSPPDSRVPRSPITVS
jgi:hypothetical protein